MRASIGTPGHVGIIMDGNGRWARARGLERAAGHRQGVAAARKAYRACFERGVENLTLYAFSYSNWKRPKDEVDMLMDLCARFCAENAAEWVERSIRLQVIGDLEELPTPTRRAVEAAVEATSRGEKMTLTLALGYGCRNDLVGAVRAIAAQARAGMLLPEEVDERSLRSFMTTQAVPDPDLIVRTGGERRLSDFMLFECANAELFFCDAMWPDFDEAILDEAIAVYSRRQRRFGRTGDQVAHGA